MKKITIPFRATINVTLEPGKETVFYSTEIHEEIRALRKRSQAVAQSSLDIEEWIKDILGMLLFSKQDSQHFEFLKGIFLDSDFCMFSSKIKILNTTLKHFNLLRGKERSEVENILPKVNRYRNAFAHGKIFPRNGTYYVTYFEGASIEKELNEEYWAELEKVLNRAHELMKILELKVAEKT